MLNLMFKTSLLAVQIKRFASVIRCGGRLGVRILLCIVITPLLKSLNLKSLHNAIYYLKGLAIVADWSCKPHLLQ